MHIATSLAEFLRSARLQAHDATAGRGPSPMRIGSALRRLRNGGHHAVRILDLECGSGERLIDAARQAQSLGFLAIEGCGASLSMHQIHRARYAAGLQPHASTALDFEISEPIGILASEQDGAADLVLLSSAPPYPASPLAMALARVCLGEVLGDS